jgi:hypothetical protein
MECAVLSRTHLGRFLDHRTVPLSTNVLWNAGQSPSFLVKPFVLREIPNENGTDVGDGYVTACCRLFQ